MTESNVFNQSFDDLLAQAGIAGSSTNGEPPVNEKPKTEPAVMSFDDILQQEGLEDVTNNPSTANEVTEEPNITEEYRVTTDVFGENDKPNDLPTFEDLMAQAGGIETKETATEQVNETKPLWKKDKNNMNIPYTNEDLGTELVIVVIDNDKKGLFIIPNEVAICKKILSTKNSKEKMSMRFYPPWCTNLNTTAQSTQKWQLKFFREIEL